MAEIIRREVDIYTKNWSRKLSMGMVYFIPEVNCLGECWKVWNIVFNSIHKGRVNHRIIKHTADSCGVERPLSCNLAEAITRQREAR